MLQNLKSFFIFIVSPFEGLKIYWSPNLAHFSMYMLGFWMVGSYMSCQLAIHNLGWSLLEKLEL